MLLLLLYDVVMMVTVEGAKCVGRRVVMMRGDEREGGEKYAWENCDYEDAYDPEIIF